MKHCLFENHFLTLHTPNRKKHEWELQNAESDSNASDTVAPDADNFTSTSITSASKPRESADATSNNGINASNSLGLKETESMRLVAKARSSFQSAQSSSQALSGFSSPSRFPSTTSTTVDRIKDFAKREASHLERNHKLREVELKSYRENLVFQRRLMLSLAYAMASVFTTLSLWVVRFAVI